MSFVTYKFFQATHRTLNKRRPQSNLGFFLLCLCLATCRLSLFPWDDSLLFLCNKTNAASFQLEQISYQSQHTHPPGWFYTHRRKTSLSDKQPVLPFKFSNRMSSLVQKTLIDYTAQKFCLLRIRVTLVIFYRSEARKLTVHKPSSQEWICRYSKNSEVGFTGFFIIQFPLTCFQCVFCFCRSLSEYIKPSSYSETSINKKEKIYLLFHNTSLHCQITNIKVQNILRN